MHPSRRPGSVPRRVVFSSNSRRARPGPSAPPVARDAMRLSGTLTPRVATASAVDVSTPSGSRPAAVGAVERAELSPRRGRGSESVHPVAASSKCGAQHVVIGGCPRTRTRVAAPAAPGARWERSKRRERDWNMRRRSGSWRRGWSIRVVPPPRGSVTSSSASSSGSLRPRPAITGWCG